jgi:ABC-type transport system involved in multi-copper enzyme maturation permease subunit
MTIKEKGYDHWDGQVVQKRFPWWPITRTGIRLTFQKKFFKFLFTLTLLPALVFLTGIYLSERLEDFSMTIGESSQIVRINPAYFKTYLTNEFLMFMVAIILVLAGSGLIADDLKFNSLQLYFSRPIRKRDYFFGKASILIFFLFLLTLVPGFVLYIMKIVFSGSLKFVGEYPWLPLSIFGYSLLATLFFTFYTLFLSSISKNKRYVIVLIVGIYFFSDILFGIFYGIFRDPYFSLFSLKVNLQQIGAAIFGVKPRYDIHWLLSLMIIVLICFFSGFVLAKKVEGVEVVK